MATQRVYRNRGIRTMPSNQRVNTKEIRATIP